MASWPDLLVGPWGVSWYQSTVVVVATLDGFSPLFGSQADYYLANTESVSKAVLCIFINKLPDFDG